MDGRMTPTFIIIKRIIKVIQILFIIFVLFFERRESTRRFAWLLVLLTLPGGGIILYVLFSGHFFTGSRRMKEVNMTVWQLSQPLREIQRHILTVNRSFIPSHVIRDFFPLMDMNLQEGNSLLSYTDSTKIYCYGKEFFDDLLQELEKAQHTICMEYFIFHQDTIGRRIMEVLCRKAQEGVDVKLIYDDFGSLRTRASFFRQLSAAGGKARAFFLIRLGLPLTLNYRNHRKVTIIDSRIGFLGGMNIGDEYANMNPHVRLNWRDTTIRMTGSSVLNLQTNFLMDWYSIDAWNNRSKTLSEAVSYFPPSFTDHLLGTASIAEDKQFIAEIFQRERIPTQIITAGPNRMQKANIEDALIRMIMSARKNVFIETPYFTPNEEFSNALKLASYSGVSVTVIIPGKWDKFYMKAASFEFAREMCRHGVHFYLYPGFIHSKMVTVDRRITSIGTTNIDNRSFSLHFEENAIFYDERFTCRCDTIFERDRKISLEVSKEFFDAKPIINRAFWSFCKLFSPFM